MAEKIYYCKKCDRTFSSKSQADDICPSCHAPLLLTGMSAEEWRSLTEMDKPAVKESFARMYDEKYPMGIRPIDPKESAELKRRVMQNRPSNDENRNPVSRIIICIGVVIMLIGLGILLYIIATANQDWDMILRGIGIFIAFFIPGIMFVGFGEIIRLLQILVDRS